MVTAVRFSNGQEALSIDYSGAKYVRSALKIAADKKHFFVWLKTGNFSNACGTVTLKSPPPQAFSESDVHQRLRKRLARCTLDCGFKTPESPALRGFVAERGPITGTSLYLVLKSNGLRHPKNLPVKFGFSPIGISQILPKSYRYNAVPNRFSSRFSTSRTNGPRSLSLPKAGIHTRSSEKDRTQRLTRRNRGLPDGAAITTLDTYCTFTNIPGPGVRTAYFAALGSWPGGALEERRKPSGQRCAYACRCPEASRPRWAA